MTARLTTTKNVDTGLCADRNELGPQYNKTPDTSSTLENIWYVVNHSHQEDGKDANDVLNRHEGGKESNIM